MSNVLYLLLYVSGVYGLVLWPPLRSVVTAVVPQLPLTGIPLFARGAAAFIVYDFVSYWIHRAAHASPLLWRVHRVHHTGPPLGPLTTFRFHVFEIAWRMLVQFVPLYVLGVAAAVPDWVFAALVTLNVLAHIDTAWRFGPLVGPGYHAVHHRGEHANFAMTLVVWDAWFGTRSESVTRRVLADAHRGDHRRDEVARLAG